MTTNSSLIETKIHELLVSRGTRKTICPSEVARAIAGKDEKKWRLLMKPVRTVAVNLTKSGTLVITRKGKPVDPDDFKGIYRIALAQPSD
ncbi:MAG: DUF3253 domain-containing protein [Hyphomicrobiales bacterium]